MFLNKLGACRFQIGDIEGGITSFRRALREDPSFRVARRNLRGLIPNAGGRKFPVQTKRTIPESDDSKEEVDSEIYY